MVYLQIYQILLFEYNTVGFHSVTPYRSGDDSRPRIKMSRVFVLFVFFLFVFLLIFLYYVHCFECNE